MTMKKELSAAAAKQRIEVGKKTGRMPDRQILQILLSAQSQFKDDAVMADTLEERRPTITIQPIGPRSSPSPLARRACVTRTRSG